METYAKVIADSVNEDGHRVTTMEVCFHRFVLAEFNTHRVFSRNSASSRAIPVTKQIERLWRSPAWPVSWPREQKGMQGGDALSTDEALIAQRAWGNAMQRTIETVQHLRELGLHKSVSNRLLEPFMWHTVVVTSTAWENFFAQRCSPLAQPEIQAAALLMRTAYQESSPEHLYEGQWHLPYIDEQTVQDAGLSWSSDMPWEGLRRVSAARCARVSYLTQDGKRDPQADLALYNRLVQAKPAHWSPLEHVATPWPGNRQRGSIWFDHGGKHHAVSLHHLPKVGNLLGWRSLRTEVEAEARVSTFS